MEQHFDKKKTNYPVKSITFESLPVDAIFLILEWLDAADLLAMCCVSKHFRELSSNDCLWKKFSIHSNSREKLFPNARKTFHWKKTYCNARRWAKGCLKQVKLHSSGFKNLMPWLQICAQETILVASQGSDICSYSNRDLVNDKKLNSCVISELKGHRDDVVRFVKSGTKIFSASMDRTVRVWSVKQGKKKCCAVLQGHQKGVYCVDANRSVIISGSKDQTVKMWSNMNYSCVKTVSMSDLPRCLCINNFTSQFLVGVAAHNTRLAALRIYDLNTGKFVSGMTSTGRDTERLGAGILQLKMEDPQTVLSCGYDTTVRLWDLRSRRCVRSWPDPHDNAVFCLESNRDFMILSGTNRHGVVRLWDKRTSEPIRSFFTATNKGSSPVYALQFSQEGLYVGLSTGIQIFRFSK